jgi:Arc/MetJ family transcription regulator
MARTVIDLDAEALQEAAEVLGTRTKVDTVNTALREIANRARRLAYVKALADGDIDLGEEALRGAWR